MASIARRTSLESPRTGPRPGGSGRWSPWRGGSSGEPGTASTSRPWSPARRAVISEPGAVSRLSHHGRQRQAGDQPIAAGKVAGLGGGRPASIFSLISAARRRSGARRAWRCSGQKDVVDHAAEHALPVPVAIAPSCAAPSMPRATCRTPPRIAGLAACPWRRVRAKLWPEAEAIRAPTMADALPGRAGSTSTARPDQWRRRIDGGQKGREGGFAGGDQRRTDDVRRPRVRARRPRGWGLSASKGSAAAAPSPVRARADRCAAVGPPYAGGSTGRR